MSVSVSAAQLRILVVAIVVVTVGQLVVVSMGDGRAASGASIAEPLTGAFTARGPSEQRPTRLYAGGPSRAASYVPLQFAGTRAGSACKDGRPVPPFVLTLEDEEMLRPCSVNTCQPACHFD